MKFPLNKEKASHYRDAFSLLIQISMEDYDHKFKAIDESAHVDIPNITENLMEVSNFVSLRSLFVLPSFQ